jgi:hypothetical protein
VLKNLHLTDILRCGLGRDPPQRFVRLLGTRQVARIERGCQRDKRLLATAAYFKTAAITGACGPSRLA